MKNKLLILFLFVCTVSFGQTKFLTNLGGTIDNSGAIVLDNGSQLRKGTINAGLGGGNGIAQICSVGFELKWEAGRLYVMGDGGTTIRQSLYNFSNTPTATDDATKGYQVGSLWSLDNGDTYVCTDNSEDNAIWVLYDSGASIPLSGTVTGSPVTGDIEVDPETLGDLIHFRHKVNETDGSFSSLVFTDDGVTGLFAKDDLGNRSFLVTPATNTASEVALAFRIKAENPLFRGLTAESDLSANITDLDYPQKIYVDNLTIKGTYNSGAVVAQTTFTVTIPTQANTDYVVVTEADNTLSAPVRYVTNKQVDSFDVVYLSALTGTVSIGYILRK
jgi:hypothetical protein